VVFRPGEQLGSAYLGSLWHMIRTWLENAVFSSQVRRSIPNLIGSEGYCVHCANPSLIAFRFAWWRVVRLQQRRVVPEPGWKEGAPNTKLRWKTGRCSGLTTPVSTAFYRLLSGCMAEPGWKGRTELRWKKARSGLEQLPHSGGRLAEPGWQRYRSRLEDFPYPAGNFLIESPLSTADWRLLELLDCFTELLF
jgi:hypothetical protein